MARDDKQQYQMPMRQQDPSRLPSRSPFGWGSEGEWWSASPFQLMRRMQDDMDRIFGSLLQPSAGGGAGAQGMTAWAPSVDVYETDRDLVVKANVPGVEPEDLEVYCTDDAVILRGEARREDDRNEGGVHRTERQYGRFERQIPLPPGTKPDQVQANFRNGVLELRIPKSEEARQQMRRIPIGGVSGSKGGEARSMESQPASKQGQTAPQPQKAAGQPAPGGKK